MKLVHTADWHLGRIFHELHLTADQAHVLDQLVAVVKEVQPDAVVIAGDVYDRAVPPPEAVGLLDDVLSRLVIDCGVTVIIIAGNHDSPDRLGFASRMLASQKLHIFSSLHPPVKPVMLQDRYGPLPLYALPFAEPPIVREKTGCNDVCDHNSAMRALTRQLSRDRKGRDRAVLVAHAFVPGCRESESERPLSVGGAGTVDAACFDGFSYVALGHLHAAQAAAENIHYAGSLLKYSFDEAQHTKSVNLVEIDQKGGCAVERIALVPRHDVRCVRGTLAQLLAGPHSDDYLMVTLTEREPVLDAMGKLRQRYPNTLHIEREFLSVDRQLQTGTADHRTMTARELFSAFFRQVAGENLSQEQMQAFASVLEEREKREREVVS